MQCGRFPKRPLAIATGPTLAVIPELVGAAQEDLPVAADRVRAVRVAVRVAPRPLLAGDGQFVLDRRRSTAAGRRSRSASPHRRRRGCGCRKSLGWNRGRVAGVVHHRPADSAAGVVGPQRHRVVAGDDPRFGPVQVVRAGLVADPVGVRVPERSRVQGDDLPAGAGQALEHGGPARAAPDDHQVDLVGVGEAAHVLAQSVVGAGAVVRAAARPTRCGRGRRLISGSAP